MTTEADFQILVSTPLIDRGVQIIAMVDAGKFKPGGVRILKVQDRPIASIWCGIVQTCGVSLPICHVSGAVVVATPDWWPQSGQQQEYVVVP